MQLYTSKLEYTAQKPKRKTHSIFAPSYMYAFIRNILFLLGPEWAHYFSMNSLKVFSKLPFIRKMLKTQFSIDNPLLGKKVFGIVFKNQVGLGAGFDKNARYLNILESLGFGFIEIGTVTPLPQAGNVKPRLFRLPVDKALVNRMGFNNEGSKAVAERLKKWSMLNAPSTKILTANERMIIGGNIGKNKLTPNEDAWKDYCTCFKDLYPYVDYFVVNVSSPNTPGLRELHEKDALAKILGELQLLNKQKEQPRPLLLKISPDLSIAHLNKVIDLAVEIKLDGLVVANTTISRDGLSTNTREVMKVGAGGLSGLPLKQRSLEMIAHINLRTNGQVPIIASGGIFNGTDAMEKIKTGAVLVQVWTGFIYEGPRIVKNICTKIVTDLK